MYDGTLNINNFTPNTVQVVLRAKLLDDGLNVCESKLGHRLFPQPGHHTFSVRCIYKGRHSRRLNVSFLLC